MKSLLLLILVLASPAAHATTPVATLLQEFGSDSARFMQLLPEKENAVRVRPFTKEDILDRAFIDAKNDQRPLNGRAKMKKGDRPEDIVDRGQVTYRNIYALDTPNLLKAELETHPWSDWYWALHTGQLAYRYADPAFPKTEDKPDFQAVDKYLRATIGRYSSVETLSPAEKYDLLIGDEKQSLTHNALSDGESYFKEQGKVEDWMGLCHGWAPASYMVPRPTHAVQVMAADGKTLIPFYPSDIKALASLLWANETPELKFMGGRCDKKHPKTDPNGRIKSQDCFDNNPGSWHLAVVNQIAVNKRSFIMDATYDYEVWNQPVVGYEISYFDPRRLEPVKKLEKAKVALADFSNDRFADYRAKKATYVVGISMKLTYATETSPRTSLVDDRSKDDTNTVTYLYDLELDADGNVIGGEWYYNAHPDFLWTPDIGARALGAGDQRLIKAGADREPWDGKTALPADWRDVAVRAAGDGSPLALIVEALVRLSTQAP